MPDNACCNVNDSWGSRGKEERKNLWLYLSLKGNQLADHKGDMVQDDRVKWDVSLEMLQGHDKLECVLVLRGGRRVSHENERRDSNSCKKWEMTSERANSKAGEKKDLDLQGHKTWTRLHATSAWTSLHSACALKYTAGIHHRAPCLTNTTKVRKKKVKNAISLADPANLLFQEAEGFSSLQWIQKSFFNSSTLGSQLLLNGQNSSPICLPSSSLRKFDFHPSESKKKTTATPSCKSSLNCPSQQTFGPRNIVSIAQSPWSVYAIQFSKRIPKFNHDLVSLTLSTLGPQMLSQ